jgi:hypothetical protein
MAAISKHIPVAFEIAYSNSLEDSPYATSLLGNSTLDS